MKVFMTGATGFIGRALAMRLLRDGHEVAAWVRSPERARALLGADVELVASSEGAGALRAALGHAQAAVHLAGESVAKGRWTRQRRRKLLTSRAGLAAQLVGALRATDAAARPKVLASASAVGIYGSRRGDDFLDEASVPGVDFLAELCRAWEGEVEHARALGMRVVRVRLGLVLGNEGGSLQKMLPLFRLGLGAALGPGTQHLSWIHLRDAVEIFARALGDPRFDGPINAVAPNPVTNREFTDALAAVVRRRARLRIPAPALRALFGGVSEALLSSQRVLPRRLYELGYEFEFRELSEALADLLGPSDIALGPLGRDQPRPLPGADGEDGGRHPVRFLLRQRTAVEAPREAAYAFFAKSENLGAITPPAMQFRIVGAPPQALGAGALVDYRLRVAGVPVRWRTRIERSEPPRLFVDSQVRGPYARWWHEHHFEADGARTLMEDRVYYTPPLGLIGRIANRLFVAPALERIFRYRRDVIRLRFGYRSAPGAQARAAAAGATPAVLHDRAAPT